jgi:hypothetical protein
VKTCEDLYLKRAEIKLLFSALSFENYMCISQERAGQRDGLSVVELEPRAEEPKKLNCLLEPEPKLKLRIAAPEK